MHTYMVIASLANALAAGVAIGYWRSKTRKDHEIQQLRDKLETLENDRLSMDSDDSEDESDDDSCISDDVSETPESFVESLKVTPGELKMIFCVRTDLGMSKGKIVAQCGHACLGTYRKALRSNPDWVKAWHFRGSAKIALKVANEEIMDDIAAGARSLGLPHYTVEDAGRTQIAAGSRTVVGIGPAPKDQIDKLTGPQGMFPLKLL